MSDSFWAMLAVVLPVLIVQVVGLISARRVARRSADDRRDIKTQVAQVQEKLLTTSSMRKEDIEKMCAGAERHGYVQGIKEGKRQATGPAPL